jgi:predicted small metal-binding protein
VTQFPQVPGGETENFMTGERIGLMQDLASVDIGYRANQNVNRIEGMVTFKCSDIGIDCPFEAQATTAHEIMRKFIDHAESDHKMQVLSADVIFKVQNAIKK